MINRTTRVNTRSFDKVTVGGGEVVFARHERKIKIINFFGDNLGLIGNFFSSAVRKSKKILGDLVSEKIKTPNPGVNP